MEKTKKTQSHEINEEEIRPQSIFDEYIQLSKEDCKNFFPAKLETKVECPAGCTTANIQFCKKEQFNYKKCSECGSIYIDLTAGDECFESFYTNGRSTEYWANVFYKKTEAKREKLLWEPKLESIIETFQLKEKKDQPILIDIGGGFGTFAKLAANKYFGVEKTMIIEPNPKLAEESRNKGIKVIRKFTNEVKKDELPKGRKLFTSFELLEHLRSPKEFLESINRLMDKGDMLYMTTLSGDGIDINELKEHSKAITPPHHINFLSPSGIEKILSKIGFSEITTKTPGVLDVNILEKQSSKIMNESIKKIITRSDKESKEALQRLIVSSKISSHMHIYCKK